MDLFNRRKPQAGAVGWRFFEYFLLAAQRKYSAAGLPPAKLLLNLMIGGQSCPPYGWFIPYKCAHNGRAK